MAPLVAELGTGGLRGDAEKWRNGGSVNPQARREVGRDEDLNAEVDTRG
jgi:hypothetical protein